MYKKLSVLLAIVLCSLFVFAVPEAAKATPAPETAESAHLHTSDEAQFSITAGEVSAGDAEGILQQVNKNLLSPLTKLLLQLLYPQFLISEPVPAHHPFLSGSSIRHSILTKGP